MADYGRNPLNRAETADSTPMYSHGEGLEGFERCQGGYYWSEISAGGRTLRRRGPMPAVDARLPPVPTPAPPKEPAGVSG